MSEMIERVAQAICGDDNPENILAIHRIRARTAIEAMRSPTEAMLIAGGNELDCARELYCWQAMIDAALS
jgi:hypothetical protein